MIEVESRIDGLIYPMEQSKIRVKPAKHCLTTRKLPMEERAGLKWWAQTHVDNGAYCLKYGINVGGPLPS